jgi:hypothetical protein
MAANPAANPGAAKAKDGAPDLKGSESTAKIRGTEGEGKGMKGSLTEAIFSGNLEEVQVWMEAHPGYDVNQEDTNGWYALKRAARQGSPDILRYLIESGCHVEPNENESLLTAASWGNWQACQVLVDNGAKVIAGSEEDWKWTHSPVVLASQYGHLSTLRFLVIAKADINELDAKGNDALMGAWASGHANIVGYIVRQGGRLRQAQHWVQLATSADIALDYALGTAARMDKLLEDYRRGEIEKNVMQKRLDIPLSAICVWVQKVSEPALILLDQVLMRQDLDAPSRARMVSDKIRTAYVSSYLWNPKEHPRQEYVCPAVIPGQPATNSTVYSVQLSGIVSTEFLFAFATCQDRQLFNSRLVSTLLHHTWAHFMSGRFLVDVLFEGFTLMSLMLWMTFSTNGYLAFIAVIWLGLQGVADALEDWRQRTYFNEGDLDLYRNIWSMDAGFSAMRVFRFIFSFVVVIIALVTQPWNNESDHTIIPVLGIMIFTRWIKLFNLLASYEFIGNHVTPIMYAMAVASQFAMLLLIVFGSIFLAALCISPVDFAHLWDSFIIWYRFLIARNFKEKDVFTGVDPDGLPGDYTFNAFWALTGVITVSLLLLNIFVVIIIESYDFGKEYSQVIFRRSRASKAFCYLLAAERTAMAPAEKVYQGMLKNMFAQEFGDGKLYLWSSEFNNERNMEMTKVEDGRLRMYKTIIQHTTKQVYGQIQDKIDELGEFYGKTHDTFEREFREFQRQIRKSHILLLRQSNKAQNDALVAVDDQ